MADWINQAIAILRANGVPADKMNPNDIWMIIKHESGGNPHAINNWDSNAAKGTPSKGLMQTIDPTFNSYKLPGHGDIYNPVDNIIAGVRYSIARYGSVSNVPGVVGMKTGGGYQGY
ncbi:transglycosylase SLT domain-containing protein [Nonomuraea rubra]|uniref:transglycosylase SLT domain-containing protein n=1 Tax=Nonomuraea rubra TaxID=46180 RepID=UPI00361790FF